MRATTGYVVAAGGAALTEPVRRRAYVLHGLLALRGGRRLRVAFRLTLPRHDDEHATSTWRVPELHDLLTALGVAGLGDRRLFTVANALTHLLDNTGVVEDVGSGQFWVYRQRGMQNQAGAVLLEDPAVGLPDWFEAGRGLPRGECVGLVVKRLQGVPGLAW